MAKENVRSVEKVAAEILKKSPPELKVTADGTTETLGWTSPELTRVIYVAPPQDGVQDFDFVAEPPKEVVGDAVTPIKAEHIYPNVPPWIRGVRVRAATNTKETLL